MTDSYDGSWVFFCDGCNKVTPSAPVCVDCGARYVFHGTPEGDKVFARILDGLRRATDEWDDDEA